MTLEMKEVVYELMVTVDSGLVVDLLSRSGMGRTFHCSQFYLDGVEVSATPRGFRVKPSQGREMLLRKVDDTVYVEPYL